MTVTIEQVQAGLIRYIDAELAPKAIGIAKFGIYFMAPSIPKMVTQKISEARQSGVFAEMFDENGNIELDEVYKRAQEAIKHSGKVLIKSLNYFADAADIEALYTAIKNS